LRQWVERSLRETVDVDESWIAERVLLRLDLVVQDGQNAAGFIAHATSAEVLVDVVDALLDLLSSPRDPGKGVGVPGPRPISRRALSVPERREELARLLGDALSVLRVRADGRGLERRPGIGTEEAFRETVRNAEAAADAGSAAAHLREAWGCAYALHPDPGKAYGEAIKAVEAAAHAVLLPADAMATLGKMRGHLGANHSKFALVIGGPDGRGDVSPLLDCISLLWDGQTSRHGSRRPTRSETLEEAVMAVHLAVMLVQWFTSGAVRKA
jgi:hypothetical protein